jgi:hypothetical protein
MKRSGRREEGVEEGEDEDEEEEGRGEVLTSTEGAHRRQKWN